MKQQTTNFLLIAALLVVAAAALLFLNFQLARTELATNSQASRFTMSVDAEHPVHQGVDLDLYVLVDGRLDSELAERLAETLRDNPYVGNVTLREEPLQAAPGSCLVVRVAEPGDFLWTPFYTKTGVDVEFAYASDGDVTWMEASPVVMESSDPPQPVVRVQADLQFDGTGYGLISRPAYDHYLAGEMAKQINTLLETQLATATG